MPLFVLSLFMIVNMKYVRMLCGLQALIFVIGCSLLVTDNMEHTQTDSVSSTSELQVGSYLQFTQFNQGQVLLNNSLYLFIYCIIIVYLLATSYGEIKYI